MADVDRVLVGRFLNTIHQSHHLLLEAYVLLLQGRRADAARKVGLANVMLGTVAMRLEVKEGEETDG